MRKSISSCPGVGGADLWAWFPQCISERKAGAGFSDAALLCVRSCCLCDPSQPWALLIWVCVDEIHELTGHPPQLVPAAQALHGACGPSLVVAHHTSGVHVQVVVSGPWVHQQPPSRANGSGHAFLPVVFFILWGSAAGCALSRN